VITRAIHMVPVHPDGTPDVAKSKREGWSIRIWAGALPVTLYKEQWIRLLAVADEIRNFIRENVSALKTKE
jgi:hypothetical protein